MKTTKLVSVIAAVLVLGCAANIALAQPPRDREDRVEQRENYPPRGRVVRALPPDRVPVVRGNDRYYYSRGAWYAPRGPRFVVVAPPVGVFVPVLPSVYATIWIGGLPYYRANDAYYVYRDRERGYEVVDPPSEQEAATAKNDELFVYPANGQTAEQLAKDRYECHRWATGETSFDPTLGGGGVPEDQTAAKRADYQRALTACLTGRGYSVK